MWSANCRDSSPRPDGTAGSRRTSWPYLDVVVEAFGTSRLMIGSDWPVCTLAADYARTMGLVIDYVNHRHPGAADAIFGGNAAAFYGVG